MFVGSMSGAGGTRCPCAGRVGSWCNPSSNAMPHKRDSQHGQFPSLTPMTGADRKLRLLDKEVHAIGRARGCDILIDATEVSAVHCLLYWSTAGFRVRDCGSRTGTRVNGATVKNMHLTDGDVLQIGPFSFEVKLPKQLAVPPTIDLQKWERAAHSRRNLVRLALQ